MWSRSAGGTHRVFSGVDTCGSHTATQTNPTAPVMMKDQRHDNVSISQATAGAPSASPREDPQEIAAIAVPHSV
jgi:hypothetical protein